MSDATAALDFARHIASEQPLGSNDWACARCHPNSDILVVGFTCVVHRAIDVANGVAAQEPAEPVNALLLREMRYIAGISTGQVKRVAEHALAAIAQPAEPQVCESCAPDGKCMNRRALCTIMLNRPQVDRKKPDDTEGGAL